jgi:putative methionine-R-sulfoxide reductase with GAF domain
MSRSLASLAHGLAVAPSAADALRSLAEALADVDRYAQLALIQCDERQAMLTERVIARTSGIDAKRIDTTIDHLPTRERTLIANGGQFIDFGDKSDEYARLLHLPAIGEAGWLSIRGLIYDGGLAGLLVIHEPRKMFGMRTTERVAPAVSLFELAYLRLRERDARMEAVETLEHLAQRVHGEYERKFAALEARLREASTDPGAADRARIVELEKQLVNAGEDVRKTHRRAEAVEATVTSAVAELEKAHVELHRRSEQLRQRTRTLYLLDRVLTLDRITDDPRRLAEGLIALVGDDMQAHRCSLMLRTADTTSLYLAASRGLDPAFTEGLCVPIGQGVAGKVAATREPILVQDVAHAKDHPLLHDELFTTGSFISFPLVYHNELLGVVNLSNRAQRGVFVEEDIDRVRLLGSVIALVAAHSRLNERLVQSISLHSAPAA